MRCHGVIKWPRRHYLKLTLNIPDLMMKKKKRKKKMYFNGSFLSNVDGGGYSCFNLCLGGDLKKKFGKTCYIKIKI